MAATTTATTTTETTTAATTTTNPFRAPAVSPHPTGVASDIAAPLDTTGLDEDLPPAYTPAPDIQHGESTIQQGPRRPFQTAPRPVQHTPHIAPARPPPPVSTPRTQTQLLFRQIRDSISSAIDEAAYDSRPRASSNWTSYPGARVTRSTSSQGTAQTSPRAPPLPPRPATTNPPLPEMSDFAREFYAAGAADPVQHQRRSSASSESASSHVPTTVPTPGRPLLRDGKLLVYPKGFVCRKCTFFVLSLCYDLRLYPGNNIGYKHSDPSDPCKKCWSKYAKPFSGPLAYSYSAPSDSSTSSTFQQPLPNFRSPRSPRSPPAPAPLPQPHPPHHVPANYGHPQPHPPVHQPHTFSLSPYATPPPGSIVYSAGDPRLGGNLCWNCNGKGKISLFFLDLMPCEVCSGIGRVYV